MQEQTQSVLFPCKSGKLYLFYFRNVKSDFRMVLRVKIDFIESAQSVWVELSSRRLVLSHLVEPALCTVDDINLLQVLKCARILCRVFILFWELNRAQCILSGRLLQNCFYWIIKEILSTNRHRLVFTVSRMFFIIMSIITQYVRSAIHARPAGRRRVSVSFPRHKWFVSTAITAGCSVWNKQDKTRSKSSDTRSARLSVSTEF